MLSKEPLQPPIYGAFRLGSQKTKQYREIRIQEGTSDGWFR